MQTPKQLQRSLDAIGHVLDVFHGIFVWIALLIAFPMLFVAAYALFTSPEPTPMFGVTLSLLICFPLALLDSVRVRPDTGVAVFGGVRRLVSTIYLMAAVAFMIAVLAK